MITLILASAWGADLHESNVSATTVGAQYWQSSAVKDIEGIKANDLDLLVGQRLRWTLIGKENFHLRARADARFVLGVDGDEAFFQRNRVRTLGLSFLTRKWTLDVGRHPVHKGGPRLVDGLQFVYHVSKKFELGVWGGLAPDLFTTDPRLRPGGGPILAFTASRFQLSVVGEVLTAEDGLDRVGALAMARLSAARTIEVSGRLDMDLISAEGGPHLADAQAFVRWAPVPAMRFDVFYDAFSSYRYLKTENLDPDIQRFDLRLLKNDIRLPALLQNCLEPKVAHAMGSTLALQPDSDGVAPRVAVAGRYRFGTPEGDVPLFEPGVTENVCAFDDVNEFLRVNPQIGLMGIPLGGRLDVRLDANLYQIEGRSQYDGGIIVFWEPSDDGVFAIDLSYRALINPFDEVDNPLGYDGLGHYGDLFVDLVVEPADLMVGAGVNVVTEPGVIVSDTGIGAFARITKYLRKRK